MLWPPRWPYTLGKGPACPSAAPRVPPGGIVTPSVKLGQLNELTAVERQRLDLAVVDDLGDFGVRRAQQRRLAGHRDGVGQLAELKNDQQFDLLPDVQCEPVLLEALEAGELDEYLIVADRQRRQNETAFTVRHAFGPAPACHVKGHDVCARDDTALAILDDSGQLRSVVLRASQGRHRHDDHEGEDKNLPQSHHRGRLNHEPSGFKTSS